MQAAARERPADARGALEAADAAVQRAGHQQRERRLGEQRVLVEDRVEGQRQHGGGHERHPSRGARAQHRGVREHGRREAHQVLYDDDEAERPPDRVEPCQQRRIAGGPDPVREEERAGGGLRVSPRVRVRQVGRRIGRKQHARSTAPTASTARSAQCRLSTTAAEHSGRPLTCHDRDARRCRQQRPAPRRLLWCRVGHDGAAHPDDAGGSRLRGRRARRSPWGPRGDGGSRLGVPRWAEASSPAELPFLDEVDAITCGTAPFAHHGVIKAALEAGKAVLTEKPFTMTVAEGEELHRGRARTRRHARGRAQLPVRALRAQAPALDRRGAHRDAARDLGRADVQPEAAPAGLVRRAAAGALLRRVAAPALPRACAGARTAAARVRLDHSEHDRPREHAGADRRAGDRGRAAGDGPDELRSAGVGVAGHGPRR